jgi:hypothetical protein
LTLITFIQGFLEFGEGTHIPQGHVSVEHSVKTCGRDRCRPSPWLGLSKF